jgi:oligopeptide transport system substrate-binding protein
LIASFDGVPPLRARWAIFAGDGARLPSALLFLKMKHFLPVIAGCLALLVAGCGPKRTRAENAVDQQILLLGNGAEPQGLDPHRVEGITEHHILMALSEGLAGADPKTLEPKPGQAESWEISPDKKVYTFHLRKNAIWSNGDPVTADDFVQSYIRILTPSLGSHYAEMLHCIKNAKAFNHGEIKDSSQLGLRAIDAKTLEVTLECPTPYLLSMIALHYTWWPVHMATIRKFGDPYSPGNTDWTRPENMVCNGPFVLTVWKPSNILSVRRNTNYWNTANVKLNGIDFFPIESYDSEERSFRAGQLHQTESLPQAKIDVYKKDNPGVLRLDPYLANYFYRINVTDPVLKDKRLRHALSQAIDRKAIVDSVARGDQQAAFALTPPDTAGYTPRAQLRFDIDGAKKLLAEAGYPDGKGLPPIEIHYNTSEGHKAIAEAIQQMWKKNLGIEVTLRNEEWKVYMATQNQTNYMISRAGWTGDYIDPNTFLSTFLSYAGNNRTGWNNPEYDRLVEAAACMADEKERYETFQKAEAILLDDLPLIPIYYYTRVHLMSAVVKGSYPNLLDIHPYQDIYLEAPAK